MSVSRHEKSLTTAQYLIVFVGGGIWLAWLILCPTWVGRSYFDWRQNGTFGLRGASGFPARAPLWDPPVAHSDAIDATVRWPFFPKRRHHVEIAIVQMMSRLSLALCVLGFSVMGLEILKRNRRPNHLATLAGSIAISIVIAWIGIALLAGFTMGYGATGGVVSAILALGIIGGLIYGNWSFRRAARQYDADQIADSSYSELASAETEPAASQTSGWRASRPLSLPAGIQSLAWFLLGLLCSVGLSVGAVMIASFFRGPVAGYTTLGTPQFAHSQFVVNVVTGGALAVLGSALAVLLRRRNAPRALAIAIALGTLLLGFTVAIHH